MESVPISITKEIFASKFSRVLLSKKTFSELLGFIYRRCRVNVIDRSYVGITLKKLLSCQAAERKNIFFIALANEALQLHGTMARL